MNLEINEFDGFCEIPDWDNNCDYLCNDGVIRNCVKCSESDLTKFKFSSKKEAQEAINTFLGLKKYVFIGEIKIEIPPGVEARIGYE